MQITQLNKQQALREGWGGLKGLGNAQNGGEPARLPWSPGAWGPRQRQTKNAISIAGEIYSNNEVPSVILS